jgi:diguanylate cyclase (GGDEF)-like protein/PAS domain S-box-containing protein
VTRRSPDDDAFEASFVRQILDINPHLIFAKDRSGRFTLVNRTLAEIYGTTVEELLGKSDADFNPDPEQVAHFRRDDLEVMDSLCEKFIAEELITDATGRQRWLQTIKRPIVGADGKANQVLGVATDITRHKELESELAHAALHDALTGLPNRALFRDRLGLELEAARRFPERRFAVLLVDLDRFKLVNDSLGHDAGDRLLVVAGERLGASVRPGDTVARLGGDEFALLLASPTEPREAREIAQAILARLALPVALEPGRREVYVGASVGLAFGDAATESPDQIVRDADTAMYRAKGAGRNRSAEFDPAMHAVAVAQFELEGELRRAVERSEFELHFQPIVRLLDGAVTELEALLRWRHPARGLLGPVEFLSAVEEAGLMPAIDAWLLPEACRAAARWREGGRLAGVSVNLSGSFFALDDPAALVRGALVASGLPAAALRLEIIESAVLHRVDRAAAILGDLRAEGVKTDLDDFGTGYSSLAYLHRLPIDRLKIDRSFIARVAEAGEAANIARTIVRMAESLGLETVAEGVETAAQLERVRAIRCTHAQGYLFAPARPHPEAASPEPQRRRAR